MRVAIAIVGNGAAAAEAVLALRAHGFEGDIHLFADNDHPPYNPMLGTYLVSEAIPLERAFPFGDTQGFYEANRVITHLGPAVTALDAERQTITLADESVFEYEMCLVATGARPAVPPIPGLREAVAARRRAHTIQSLDDTLRLKQALTDLLARASSSGAGGSFASGDRPHAAVVGASFAGIKIASVLHEAGVQVSLIERESSILPLSAHPDCARRMETHLLEQGYQLHLGAALAGVDVHDSGVKLDFGALPGTTDPGGAGGTACDESPAQEDVDLVVVCTGTRPSLAFLSPGQIDVGTGILVDEHQRSSIPTLYAAGDVAQGKNLLSGRHEIIGLWASARYQGRAAGRSMAGAPSGYPGGVPHNITHVGSMLFASVGCLNDYDAITTCSEGDTFQVRVWQEGRLKGVNLLNCCSNAGVLKQAFLRAAGGAVTEMEATWTSFNE